MKVHSILVSVLALLLLATPVLVGAQGLEQVPNPTGTLAGNNLVGGIIFVLNGLLVLAALAALVFLIIGGVQYIVSQGDEEGAATAKNTILYALIGLLVIGLAAVAVNFIVNIFVVAP
jgi:hypothetical protein